MDHDSKPKFTFERDKPHEAPLLRHSPFQLAACRVDVSSPWTANESGNAGFYQYVLKRSHGCFRGRAEVNSWAGIERDQVYLAANAPDQLNNFAGVLWAVIHAVQ